jgi:hypothetical protein
MTLTATTPTRYRTLRSGTGRRWPAHWAAGWIGVFCAVVLLASGWNQFVAGNPLDDGGRIALLATALRLLSVGIALATVQAWGARLPAWTVLAAAWGAAAVQLVYPLAETVVKAGILVGVIEPFGKGISNMSPEGWFNFGAAWLVWGVPGVFFALAALDFRRRNRVPVFGALLGLVGGVAFLAGLGFLIG